MTLACRNFRLTLAVVTLLLATAAGVNAQGIVVAEYGPPVVTPYYPVQRVVAYAPAPVAFYAPRAVYAPAPVVSYYAPPVVPVVTGPVTTVRYGVFGKPRAATTYYPGYLVP